MSIKSLVWTEEKKPNDEIRYNHVIAVTPFGRFLVTWKGWKKYDSPTIDETPWGGWGGVGVDLQAAKETAEEQYIKKISEGLGL